MMTHGADMMLRALAMTYSEICKMEVERLKGENFDKKTLIKYYGDMSKMISKLLRMQKCGELFETYLESSEEQHSQWFYNKGYEDGYRDGKKDDKKALEQEPILDKIRAELIEEKECAYADFERYKVEYLGQDWEDALDSLPQDDFRYGIERCIGIIDKYTESEDDEE